MSSDTKHNTIITDLELERGYLQPGQLVHLSTVTHAFRGTVDAITPSLIFLRNGVLVDSTGEVGNYAQTKRGEQEGTIVKGARIFAARGALSWGIVWD